MSTFNILDARCLLPAIYIQPSVCQQSTIKRPPYNAFHINEMPRAVCACLSVCAVTATIHFFKSFYLPTVQRVLSAIIAQTPSDYEIHAVSVFRSSVLYYQTLPRRRYNSAEIFVFLFV